MTDIQDNHGERIARLEERTDQHDANWEENRGDHRVLMAATTRIETNIMVYKYVVWTAGLIIGSIAGFVVREWDWLITRVGH